MHCRHFMVRFNQTLHLTSLVPLELARVNNLEKEEAKGVQVCVVGKCAQRELINLGPFER